MVSRPDHPLVPIVGERAFTGMVFVPQVAALAHDTSVRLNCLPAAVAHPRPRRVRKLFFLPRVSRILGISVSSRREL